MDKKLTDAQQRVVRRFKEGGGSGVIDRYGRLVIAGELIPTTPDNVLRMVALGIITGEGGRLSLNVREGDNV